MVEQVEMTARERLLDAAARLFYADGIAATGINAITAEAGVARMSLYNNFASKEELMLAYIEARHQEWLGLYRARAREAGDAKAGVLAVFDAYIDHAELGYEHGFRGCGLLNAAAELPVGSPGRDVVRWHKEQVESILTDHLQVLTTPERAAELAGHCALLLEGGMARAGLEGQAARLEQAKRIAAVWLAPSEPGTARRPAGHLRHLAAVGHDRHRRNVRPRRRPNRHRCCRARHRGTAPGRDRRASPPHGTAGSSPASGGRHHRRCSRWRSTRWPSTARCTPPVSRSALWSLWLQPRSPPGVLERLVDGRALSRWWMLAASLGILGSALLCASKLGQDTGSGASTVLGIGLGLVAGSTYAIYSWASHRLMNSGISRAASMGAVFGGGGLLLMPVLVVTGAPLLATPQAFAVGAYMALVPMFLGYLLFGYGLTKVSASTATTVTLTEPAIATLLAVLIVGERLGMLGWTGLAVIAVVLVILAVAPTNADQHPPATTAPADTVAAAR